jgi:hypothetical protein
MTCLFLIVVVILGAFSYILLEIPYRFKNVYGNIIPQSLFNCGSFHSNCRRMVSKVELCLYFMSYRSLC